MDDFSGRFITHNERRRAQYTEAYAQKEIRDERHRQALDPTLQPTEAGAHLEELTLAHDSVDILRAWMKNNWSLCAGEVRTILFQQAIKLGAPRCALLLAAQDGVDVNAVDTEDEDRNPCWWQALRFCDPKECAFFGQQFLVQLLDRGLDVNATNRRGVSVLYYFIEEMTTELYHDHEWFVQWLLSLKKAKVYTFNKQAPETGNTVLHLLLGDMLGRPLEGFRLPLFKRLLEIGVDWKIRNKKGLTCFDFLESKPRRHPKGQRSSKEITLTLLMSEENAEIQALIEENKRLAAPARKRYGETPYTDSRQVTSSLKDLRVY